MRNIQINILNNAIKLLDTPWQHNQKSTSGLDCLRFWELIARQSDLNLPELPDSYGRKESIQKLTKFLDSCFLEVGKDEIELGNLLLFNYFGSGHVGVVNEVSEQRTTFIHASAKAKKVTINSLEGKFKRHWCKTYRIVEL